LSVDGMQSRAAQRSHPLSTGEADGVSEWLHFDIHGRVGMRVAADAPTASQLSDMFAAFRTSASQPADITIASRQEPMLDPGYGEDEYEYTSSALRMVHSDVQVVADGEGFRAHGRREMLTTVLPLVDRVAAQRGAAMIHAATCDFRGHGVALPAWGGVGKTSTIAKLLKIEGVGFMGDDWAFLGVDGELLGYAKPMFIKPHHRPIYPHLFDNHSKPLIPSRLSRPVARFTTLVHPAVTRYPRIAAASRRWSPEHMMVTPQRALPGAIISRQAPLAAAIFVERYGGSQTRLEMRDRRWMVSRMVGNFNIEMPHHSQQLVAAMGAVGLLPLERAYAEKAAVLDQGLGDCPTMILQVPREMSADEASDSIVEHLRGILGDLNVL